MRWKPARLRDADVWARVDDADQWLRDADGRVEVLYKLEAGAKAYRAAAANLGARPGDATTLTRDAAAPSTAPGRREASLARSEPGAGPAVDPAAIQVWTDGACTGNPGPCGVGVVVIDGATRRELSEYLGDGTNNIAELTAIERGLTMIEDPARPVAVYSDSSYAIGLLSKNWKAKANVELVAKIRAVAARFPKLSFVKVLGHSGIPENERVDALATGAIRHRSIVRS